MELAHFTINVLVWVLKTKTIVKWDLGVGLEVLRANIAFTKHYKSPSESLQKYSAVEHHPFFLFLLGVSHCFS